MFSSRCLASDVGVKYLVDRNESVFLAGPAERGPGYPGESGPAQPAAQARPVLVRVGQQGAARLVAQPHLPAVQISPVLRRTERCTDLQDTGQTAEDALRVEGRGGVDGFGGGVAVDMVHTEHRTVHVARNAADTAAGPHFYINGHQVPEAALKGVVLVSLLAINVTSCCLLLRSGVQS